MGKEQHTNIIKGVEIFAAGIHNGDTYTEQDLDEMVTAFGQLDYRPAIKIGHSKDTPGAPSYGWVTNLRRAGNKLLADFADMHDSVVDAVRKRAYDRVSSEVYFNLKRGGKQFGKALKAVALLGAEVPAVANLIPLHKMEFAAEGEFEKVFALEDELHVTPEAMFECLSERMAGIIHHSQKESEMDLKQLQAQVKELAKKLDTLVDEGAEAEEIKKLSVQVKELKTQIATLADDDDAMHDVAAMKKKLKAQYPDKSDEEIDAMHDKMMKMKERKMSQEEIEKELQMNEKAQQDLNEANKRIAELEANERRRAVAEKVASCKVPAFRPALEAMYTYAMEHQAETIKVYSTDKDGKKTEVASTLVAVADQFTSQINAQSEKLFASIAATGGDRREDDAGNDDAGVEVDKRAKALVREKKAASYSEAMEAVLEADAVLAKRYTEQTSERAASTRH